MEITVTGESFVELDPEIARLSLNVVTEGTDRSDVSARASDVANQVAAQLRELAASGKAENVVVEPLRIYSWTQRLRTRSRANVALRVDFTDFEAMAKFQAELSENQSVEQGWVQWKLSDKTEREREEAVLGEALAQAQRRARIIADAAGQGQLSVLHVSDPGLMDSGPVMYAAAKSLSRDAAAAAPEVDITPEKLRVSARLEVRFRAE